MKVFKGWGVVLGIPALFVAAYYYPTFPIINSLRLCAVYNFLKLPCPGCGLTRSFIALAHFEFKKSIALHPLGLVVAGWLFYFLIRTIVEHILDRKLPTILKQGQRDFLLCFFVIMMLVQWVVKLLLNF